MAQPEPCPDCGSERANGVCPRCLIGLGLHGPGLTLSQTSRYGVLETLSVSAGPMPRVLLRDSENFNGPGPIVRPGSTEMPGLIERAGRLQLFGEIARGGMGAVLKGRDNDLGRDLAVKVLLERHSSDPDLLKRFVEEAQIAGQLQHPGIVPVYELGAFADHRPYFAMKLVKGRTLSDLLHSRKETGDDLPKFLGIFEQIAQTVAYAHARGVIHRDLKPSNVMVGSFGEVQVMDWGLAKVLPKGGAVDDASAGKIEVIETVIATGRSGGDDADLSRPGSVMGTPSYMAPEQARGEIGQVDERADVFALGSIFCEILTGQPAFTGRNSGEIQRKAARADLTTALTALGHPRIDAELSGLAIACLAPEADDRPRNAGEVADRVDAYRSGVQERLRRAEISGAEEKARAEEAIKRVKVERDRLRLTVALAASILGLILLGGGGWAYLARQRAARRAATEQVVGEALDKTKLLWGQARGAAIGNLAVWSDALASAETAKKLLDAAVEADPLLRDRVVKLVDDVKAEQAAAVERSVEAERDSKLIDRLEAARLVEVEYENGRPWSINLSYATAFREFGIDLDELDPAESGRRLAKRLRVKELAFYLDDWALIRSAIENAQQQEGDKQVWRRLIEAASRADPDPWRNRLRMLIGRNDPEAVDRLAADEKNWSAQPPRSMLLLAQLLRFHDRGEAAENILKAAWQLRPDDFEICLELGKTSKEERLRFTTAAVALNPERAWVRHLLVEPYASWDVFYYMAGGMISSHQYTTATIPGTDLPNIRLRFAPYWGLLHPILGAPYTSTSLFELDPKLRKAIVADLRSVVRLAPTQAKYRMQLAQMLLGSEHKPEEALKEYREAFRLEPGLAWLRYNAAADLAWTGHVDLAIGEVEAAVRIDPTFDPNAGDYRLFLASLRECQSRPDLAFPAYQTIYAERNIPANRDDDWSILFRLLTGTGTRDQVIATLRKRMKLDPEHRFNTLMLGEMLQESGNPDEAVALFQDRIGRNPDDDAEYQYGLSKVLKAKGDARGAEQAYQEAVRRKSALIADMLFSRGRDLRGQQKLDEAVSVLRQAAEFAPPDSDLARGIADHLQSAEKKVALTKRLAILIKGADKPRDAAEGLALARLCFEQKRFAAAARIWPDVFAADPTIANAREPQHRYQASCASALAGSGQGADERPTDQAGRDKFRNQAREWLRSDLVLYSRQAETGTDAARKEVVDRLTHWKKDANLAAIRDPDNLAQLPETERKDWQALWAEVGALISRAEELKAKP